MNGPTQNPLGTSERALLQVRLLGAPQITLEGAPLVGLSSAKAQGLLFYLLVTRRIHTRSALAALLWGDISDTAARRNLRKVLQQLREYVGDYLAIERDTVALAEDADVWVDVVAFETILGEMSAREAPARVQRALDLYRGDFLEGFYVHDAPDFEAWWLSERTRLRELLLSGLHDLATYHAESDDLETAVALIRRLLGFEPWREEACRHLMSWLTLSGHRGAALAQYETCRRVLADELGVEPAEETRALYERIRDGELKAAATHELRAPKIEPEAPAFLDGAAEAPVAAEEPFVGREPQLDRLSRFLASALSGQGLVAFVTGEAGWGKTSLLNAFSRQAQRSHPDLILASGTCTAYAGTGDPYLPFRDVLQMLSADVEDRWAAGTISRAHALRLWQLLPNTIAALVTHAPDLIDTFIPGEPLLQRGAAHESIDARLLRSVQQVIERGPARGRGYGPDQQRIFGQWAALLQALGDDSPLLLVLDDLHWADTSSIGLLFHLGRRLVDSPILILGAYRPEEVALGRGGREHPLAGVLDEFKRRLGDVTVHLSPASRGAGRGFVDALLDRERNRLGEDFRSRLVRETQGHPLSAVEIVREMRAQGTVHQDEEGYWVESPAISWETLPTRVEGVIETRINRLAPELRGMLAAASVEGQTFTAEVVARVRDLDVRHVVDALSGDLTRRYHLVEAGGIREMDGRRLSRYRFSHSLFQTYMYQTLDPVQRAYLHEAVGNALEVLHQGRTEEIAGRLARHFEEAESFDKAIRYLKQAGDAAVGVYAMPEAVAYYRRAVDLAREVDASGEELTALYTRLGHALDADVEHRLVAATYEEMEALARHRDDRLMLLASLVPRIRVHGGATAVHDPEAGLAFGKRALPLARELGDRAAEAEILWSLSLASFFGNRPAEAIDYGERSLALARELGLREQTAWTLTTLGTLIYLYSGRVHEAIEALNEAADLFVELGKEPFLADTLSGASIAHLYVGEYDRSIALSERALDLSRSIQDVWVQSYSQLAVAEAYRQRGEYSRAIAVAEESIRLGESASFISAQTHTRARLALVYADLGALDRALEVVKIALEVAELKRYAVDSPLILGTLARVQIISGRLADAARTIEDARADPHAEGWVVLHFPVWMAEVELALKDGQFDRAARVVDGFTGRLRQYGVRSHLPEALYLKARALLGLGREADALEPFLEARAEAEAMGTRRVLWRILDALSRLESDPTRAMGLRHEARQIIRYIVAHIDQDDLRASFLSQSDVRAVLLDVG